MRARSLLLAVAAGLVLADASIVTLALPELLARRSGVALVLDAELPPESKLDLAPARSLCWRSPETKPPRGSRTATERTRATWAACCPGCSDAGRAPAATQPARLTTATAGSVGVLLPCRPSAVTMTRCASSSRGKRTLVSPDRGTENSDPVGTAPRERTTHAW